MLLQFCTALTSTTSAGLAMARMSPWRTLHARVDWHLQSSYMKFNKYTPSPHLKGGLSSSHHCHIILTLSSYHLSIILKSSENPPALSYPHLLIWLAQIGPSPISRRFLIAAGAVVLDTRTYIIRISSVYHHPYIIIRISSPYIHFFDLPLLAVGFWSLQAWLHST